MNLLNKMTIKNLKLNKKRTIVTIIGIILSVALITAVSSIYASGIKSLINFEKHEQGNFHMSFYDVPKDDISVFENNRKIQSLSIIQDIGYAKIDSKNEYKPYVNIKAFTKDSLNNLFVKLIKGRLPENENEILIPTHLETNGRVHYNLDDEIELNVGKRVDTNNTELNQNSPYKPTEVEEKIIDTTSKKYKIVGLIERPALNIEKYTAPSYTLITYIDENNINENVDLYVKYSKDGLKTLNETTAHILGVDPSIFDANKGNVSEKDLEKYEKEMVKAKYEIDTNIYLISLETHPIQTSGFGPVVFIVIGIIIVTSVVCIKNSFDISITEKIKQYGILRSIGATKKQIKKNVFFEASSLGLIGIPLGIIFGLLASYMLILISNFLLRDELADGFKLLFGISFISIAVSIVLGIVTIYFSAFRGARKASKVSPIDSIRNSANIKINPKKIKSPEIIKKIFGIGGEISFKNIKRNKKKYRTTVVSIIVSVFIFISLSSSMNMAFDIVHFKYNANDFNISLFSDGESMYKKLQETTKLDNIEKVSILRNVDFAIDNPKFLSQYKDWGDKYRRDKLNYVRIVSVGNDEYKSYLKKLELNYEEMKNKGILINSYKNERYDIKTKKNVIEKITVYDYKIGDTISGKINDKYQYNFDIGFITDENPLAVSQYQDSKIIISDEMFDSLNTFPITPQIDAYYFSNNPDQLQKDIDQLLKDKSSYYILNDAEYIRNLNKMFTLVSIFLYGFMIVISLIGITNIFNTITTNMELRKPEFAMLKSVGMTSKEFKRMLRLESIFLGVKSLFWGLTIGIILSYIIHHFLQEYYQLPYKLPVVNILIAIIAVFILIFSLMKYSMNKINKQNTIETIRNENI